RDVTCPKAELPGFGACYGHAGPVIDVGVVGSHIWIPGLDATHTVLVQGMEGPVHRNSIDPARVKQPSGKPASAVNDRLLPRVVLVDHLISVARGVVGTEIQLKVLGILAASDQNCDV